MVEARIAKGCSFSLVLGMKGFDVLGLNTPLLLTNDPIAGVGYRYRRPLLDPWRSPGLSLTAPPQADLITIE